MERDSSKQEKTKISRSKQLILGAMLFLGAVWICGIVTGQTLAHVVIQPFFIDTGY